MQTGAQLGGRVWCVCVCVCDGCKEFSGPRVSRPVCVVVRVYINICHTDAETGLYIRVDIFVCGVHFSITKQRGFFF